MSHAAGTRYGVISLDALRDRCHLEPFTGCWEWRGALSAGLPRLWALDTRVDRMRTLNGTTAAGLLSGRLPEGKKLFYRTCRTGCCVNPEHVSIGTRKQIARQSASRGAMKKDPGNLARMTAFARAHGKLNMDLVREIRASDEPNTHWAARLGVAHNTIANVRRNKTWCETAPNASVFSIRA